MSVSRILIAIIVGAAAAWSQQAAPPPPAPDAVARAFVEALNKGDVEGAAGRVDVNLRATTLAPQRLAQFWKALNTQLGPFHKVTATRVEPGDETDTVFITCEFEKGLFDLRLPVTKLGEIAGLRVLPYVPPYRLPSYATPSAFSEREVTVSGSGWSVGGTLAVPNGKGPFPAVVLVHGSGAGDRDATIGANKPFRDLAAGLAPRGVAVLRYDKRTNLKVVTPQEEEVAPALAATALLRQTEGIDPKRIFVLGQGLGGSLAPRIGKADPSLAGLIILAANTRPLPDLIVEQMEHNATMHGAMSERDRQGIERMKGLVANAKKPDLTSATAASQLPFNIPASYWLDLRGYDPGAVAAGLKQPMLILFGERDYEVAAQDVDGWRNPLKDSKDVTFKTYPKLNHVLMEGEGVSSNEEYAKLGHVAQAVVEDVAAWVKAH